MRSALDQNFDMAMGDKDFVGTLHLFLLRYVYRPFAASVMASEGSPTVRMSRSTVTVGGQWAYNIDDFNLLPEGDVSFTGTPKEKYQKKTAVAELYGHEALAAKMEEASRGVSNSSDAMYWALKALEDSPDAAASIAARFDELIVDEAQDTSLMQVRCLVEIVRSGKLRSLFLVGDFDQSIYGFQGASVETLKQLVAAANLQEVRLTENYRSSQAICNVVTRLRSREQPDTARGPSADFAMKPGIIYYDPADIRSLPGWFEEHLNAAGLDKSDSAVVVRGNDLLVQMQGAGRVSYKRNTLFSALLELVNNGENGLSSRSLRGFEEQFESYLKDVSSVSLRREDVRLLVMRLLEDLWANEGGTVAEWTKRAADSIQNSMELIESDFEFTAAALGASKELAQRPMRDLLTAVDDTSIELSTVHGVKGRTLDGVLIVADHDEPGWRTPEWSNWIDFFKRRRSESEVQELNDEEFRILYVAMTRASRCCILALPSKARSAAVDKMFSACGFAIHP